MAHAEDPPYLTVGTEVSAKYRGAFCEATIKTAKKLVKCKVTYGKGQSSVVTSDLIKGPLKVGSQVEVKHADGHVQAATITKLTDQSTYTVVFDDGDERTLKRSSLCLKGGRHFHESESLDHLPLTDPENFGTPVMNSSCKKTGRKRRHTSQSPNREEPSKKSCRYPLEFPVGKAVFLENDRRRSSWLPAVIVPAHYVLEASDMTPDTICLRSFKDGRYFAATKNELHEFSPHKEPLQSMLEGEIQAMYMCKPAIERAMAYIDTGELPWDMDLFDNNSEHPHHHIISDPSDDDECKDESVESKNFDLRLKQFYESRRTPMLRPPTIGQHDLNLYQLYKLVMANGGMDKVTQEMKWRSLCLQLGLSNSSSSIAIRQAYKKYLYQFELHEKNKSSKGVGRECSGLTRRNKPPPSSDEEHECQVSQDHSKPKPQQDKLKRYDKLKQQDKPRYQDESEDKQMDSREVETEVNGVERPARRTALMPDKSMKLIKVERIIKPVKPVCKELNKQSLLEPEGKSRNWTNDAKPESSDLKSIPICPAIADSSWNGGEESGEIDRSSSASSLLERGGLGVGEDGGLQHCPEGYKENDRILVLYGKGKTLHTYEAKVVGLDDSDDKRDYLVHYSGWNTRYDEWIDSSRIAGKITGTIKSRPHFNKRKKSSKNTSKSAAKNAAKSGPSKFDLLTVSNLPPGTHIPSTKLPSSSQPALINITLSKPLKKENRVGKNTLLKASSTPVLTLKSSTDHGHGPRGAGRGRGGGRLDHSRSRTGLNVSALSHNRQHNPAITSTISTTTTITTTTTTTAAANTNTTSTTSCSIPQHPLLSASDPVSSNQDEGPSSTNVGDQPIIVKQEKNCMWSPPQSSPPTCSLPTSAMATVTTSTIAETNSLTDALLCSERLLGSLVKQTPSASLAEPAAQSLLSLSTSTPPSIPPASPPPQDQPSDSSQPSQSSPSLSSPLAKSPDNHTHHIFSCEEEGEGKSEEMVAEDHSSSGKIEDALKEVTGDDLVDSSTRETVSDNNSTDGDCLECTEQKWSDSHSASEKESSPLPDERKNPSPLKTGSPEGKRKLRDYEKSEDYEKRKKARQADMNYFLNFSELPPMNGMERISLIQERLREIQRRWSDLKAEVAYIERKRRRAKRKEREAIIQCPVPAVVESSNTVSPPSPHQQLNSPIPCH